MIGSIIGVISGMVGIGGGVLVIPILMFLFGFSQAKANGTSLGMLLPPIGIFAVMRYQRQQNGGWVGGWLVNDVKVPEKYLRRLFVLLLIYVVGRLIYHDDPETRAAIKTLTMMVTFVAGYIGMRLLGRHWRRAPNWPGVYRDNANIPVEHDYEI